MTEPTDAELLELNAGEIYFSESPTRYPEAGHGTQYHAGAPGVLAFARAVLAKFGTPPAMAGQLADEQIEDLLECGNPTDEEKRLIWMGWDAARNAQAVQAGAVPLKSFTTAQVERLYYNTHRANCDVSTLAAFRRVVALIESSHGIKGGQHAE